MNAFVVRKSDKKVMDYLENVISYNSYRLEAITGTISGINFNNVFVLISKHTIDELGDDQIVPDTWLNDEYKIDILK